MTKQNTNVSKDIKLRGNSVEKTSFHKTVVSKFSEFSLAAVTGNSEIQARRALIEQAIKAFINEDRTEPKRLREAAYHLIRAGGKRIRSLIILLTCEAVGGSPLDVLPICVATELLQTASLIHDDIIDQDPIRRGVQTVHSKYGLNLAILATDYLIFHAYALISKYGNRELVFIISAAGTDITIGEGTELLMSPEKLTSYTKDKYLEMAGGKTGAFMEGAARSGALVGKAKAAQIKALVKYGRMIGLAFQIRDDILDLTEMSSSSQKMVNSDLRLKRGNLPLILALEGCTFSERQNCIKALETHNRSYIKTLLENTKAIEKSEAIASSFIERAKAALQGLNLTHQDLLEQLADFVLIRNI